MSNSDNAPYIFRCSSLGDLLSGGRGKSKADKLITLRGEIYSLAAKILEADAAGQAHHKIQQGRIEKAAKLRAELIALENTAEAPEDILGDAAKSVCERVVLERIYGRLEEIESEATRHGKEHEAHAIQLFGDMIAANTPKEHAAFRKNTTRITRDGLTGECDVFFDGQIYEFKCPHSISSFAKQTVFSGGIADYLVQVQGYMYLWECEQAHIVTALFRNKNLKTTELDNVALYRRFHVRTVDRCEDTLAAILERIGIASQYAAQLEETLTKNAGFFRYKDFRQKQLDLRTAIK